MPRLTESSRQARRELIAEAAMRCFRRGGLPDTSMADIISESGLSAGSIYSHFRGKEELIRLVVEVTLARGHSLMAGGDPDQPTTPGALLHRLVPIAVPDREQARVLLQIWGEVGRDDELSRTVQKYLDLFRALLRERLADWAARKTELNGGDPERIVARTSEALIVAVHGCVVRFAIDREADLLALLADVAETLD